MKVEKTKLFVVSLLLVLAVVAGIVEWFENGRWVPQSQSNLAIKIPRDMTESLESKGAFAVGVTMQIATWNIGYASLDSQSDFFMDGGTASRVRDCSLSKKGLDVIANIIGGLKADLWLLQEIDRRSDRSCNVDQLLRLDASLGDSTWRSYADNYRVRWVPVPFTIPMGKVHSGLYGAFSAPPDRAVRVSLEGQFPWPDRLFVPQRAWMEARFPVSGSTGELVLLHLHLSAFDKGGTVRKQQLKQLKSKMLNEYDAGNYVIASGDWNSTIPGSARHKCGKDQDRLDWLQDIPPAWTPEGWTWGVPNLPTVRTLGAPLGETTCYAVVDGSLFSPGITVVGSRTMGLEFLHSDHNPVQSFFILSPRFN